MPCRQPGSPTDERLPDVAAPACPVSNRVATVGTIATGVTTTSGPTRTVTLHDVARAAGVSTATVSRAFNRPDAVRETLRQRVQSAAAELRYIPNDAARALVSNRSRVIGAIVPTIDNAIFAQGIAAIQARLERAGYGLLLAACDYDLDRELAQARTMVGRGVEALVLVGAAHRPGMRELLHRHAIPYVCQGAFAPAQEPACVGFDNRRAAYVATRYLLLLGHRRIGMIAGVQRDNDRAAARVAGVHDALVEAGLTGAAADTTAGSSTARWLAESSYSFDAARIATRHMLDAEVPVTALVCGNDILAFGALRECQARGIDVPGQVSIVGFDDLALARLATPALTSVRIPTAQMGEAAADFLLASLAGGTPQAVEVPFKLVLRASTGPVPAS